MPVTATLRNLAKMTAVGLFDLKGALEAACNRLTDKETLRRGRIHPIAILLASKTYGAGRGLKGSLTWKPNSRIVTALERAFYLAFETAQPTGKRILVAVDVSGSMKGSTVAGCPFLSAREASAAMALFFSRTEEQCQIVAFSAGGQDGWVKPKGRAKLWQQLEDGISLLHFSPTTDMAQAMEQVSSLPMGGTDCALPMLYAMDRKLLVDLFVIITDNETWAGDVQPAEALRQYRKQARLPAKLAVLATSATQFTIADPNDYGMLDMCGFDASVPQILADFATDGLYGEGGDGGEDSEL